MSKDIIKDISRQAASVPNPSKEAKIVAIALLDEQEMRNLATGFRRVFPLPDRGDFADLLGAIEKASAR